MPNLVPALPELILAIGAMALLMLGAFTRDDGIRRMGWYAVAVMAVAFLVLAGLGTGPVVTFNGMFILDVFAVFTKSLILLAAAVAVVMSMGFLEREKLERFEYPVVMLFATLGMLMMVSANDLIALYLGLELQSLSLYVLAAYQRDSARGSEAGLKYFVLGALASGLLLYGASLVYGFAGTTSFAPLAEAVGAGPAHTGVVVGLVFILAGLAFKVSAVPFHMWTPDVYEGAPTPVTAFFAVAPKIAALALLVRVLTGPFGALAAEWGQVVWLISIGSMIVGAFAAIGQTNIKRLMAYSSIGHVGYALIGLTVGDVVGVRGILIYLAIYLFMNVGTFAVILAMRHKGQMVENIADLGGLSRTHPMMALAMALFMFSMAGIPPLAGFWGKFYIFMAAIEAGLIGLAVVGVLTSVVAAFYYIRIVKVMYFDDPVEAFDRPIGRGLATVMTVAAVVIVALTVVPAPLVASAGAAAASLVGAG